MTVRVTTLDNGLRLVSERMDRVETVSLGVWVGVGTRHEPAATNGVSHLLEHMAFKGTQRRSARAIAEEIEAVGGHLNAYTARENTAYYAKVLKEDAPLALDILADILQHSVFDEEELARERDVVLQEIGQAEDTPDDIIFDHFQWAAFPDQPLGRPVLGRPGIVGGMARDTLIDYMSGSYHAPRMVLAAAGNLDHDRLAEIAAEAFAGLSGGGANGPARAEYRGGEYRESRELEQVHIVLGFPGFSITDDNYYAASLYGTLLGGGMSSRLFQEVREKRGLVYSIYSFNASFSDTGLTGVYAGTGRDQVRDLVPVIFEEMARLDSSVGEAELARAKAQMKAGLLMSLESTGARCEQLAQQMLTYGRPLTTEELIGKLEAVDQAAIGAIGERILAGPLTSAAIGPIEELETHERMSARLRRDGP